VAENNGNKLDKQKQCFYRVQAFSPKALKPMLTMAGLLTYSCVFPDLPILKIENSGIRTEKIATN